MIPVIVACVIAVGFFVYLLLSHKKNPTAF